NPDTAPTGFLTTYQHDALGNLIQVNQGAEQRNFSYDGLSRLLTASNPESGTTLYQYDSNPACAAPNASAGDLISRTDARGIRTCYQLDALHRLTQKNYSDGITPTVGLTYDVPTTWWTTENPIGRLTRMDETGVSAEGFSYDPMGRPLHFGMCTPNTCGWSGFDFYYQYDAAGDRTLEQYPRASENLVPAFDLAGRPTSLASSTMGTLISSVSYDARGNELSS